MSIMVRWIWKCDLCGVEMHHEYKTYTYAEEMARDNRGWISNLDVPKEYRHDPTEDICIACPQCKERPIWKNYHE